MILDNTKVIEVALSKLARPGRVFLLLLVGGYEENILHDKAMYQKQFRGASRVKNYGFRKRTRAGSSTRSRSNGSRSKSGARRSYGAKRGGGSFIHPSKFINKAVTVEKAERYVPKHRFVDFAISSALKRNIVTKKYVVPTPIQDRAIPEILAGKDVVGIANTGTGKTAAFLIPLINKVMRGGDQVLIVAPTRELAVQINDELKSFARGLRIFSVCCVGGTSISAQIRSLRRTSNFVVGTPGRLKDLVNRGVLRLADFDTIVLDEADRMLDMGFIADMRFLIDKMPKVRHTLFFSATISSQIEGIIKEFLRDPVRISVKTGDTAANVEQDIVKVAKGAAKLDILHDLLIQDGFSRVLVFARTKRETERLARALVTRGFKAESIHGNKSQSQRQRALTGFRNHRTQILVATDVAARGLDIDDVSHVINYDIPATYDDYVHRIGRTGRGNKRGKALTFVG